MAMTHIKMLYKCPVHLLKVSKSKVHYLLYMSSHPTVALMTAEQRSRNKKQQINRADHITVDDSSEPIDVHVL